MENADLPVNAEGEVQMDLRRFFAWLPKHYDHVVVGDTNHGDKYLHDFFNSSEFLGGLKEGGITIVGREVDRKQNIAAEKLFNETPAQTFQDENASKKIIEAARAKCPASECYFQEDSAAIRSQNLKVAYIDADRNKQIADAMISDGVAPDVARKSSDVIYGLFNQMKRLADALFSSSPVSNTWNLIWNDKEFFKGVWDAILNPMAFVRFLWHREAIFTRRTRETNQEMADNIKAVKEDAPIAVILGNGHMAYGAGNDENKDGKIDLREADVDEMLGKKTVWVNVYNTQKRAGSNIIYRALTYGVKDDPVRDKADYTVYLDGKGGGKIIKTAPEKKPETEKSAEPEKSSSLERKNPLHADVPDAHSGLLPAQALPLQKPLLHNRSTHLA